MKRIISLLLTMAMVCSLCVFSVSADNTSLIDHIETRPITIYENVDGFVETAWVYNESTDDFDEIDWFCYYLSCDEYVTFYMKDGSALYGYEIWDLGFYYSIETDQDYDNMWHVGTYTAWIVCGDFRVPITVNVVPSPVKSFTVKPVSVIEGIDCYKCFDEYYEDEEWYTTEEYDRYYYTFYAEYTITMADGSVIKANDNELADLFGHSAFERDDQSYDNQWGVGKHMAEIEFMGITVPVEVTILPHSAGCPSNVFSDAPKYGNWAHEGIDFAVGYGLFSGNDKGQFLPNDTMTRAMLVVVLYNLDGHPSTKYKELFSDVKESKWYATAVTWAAQNNVVSGVGNGKFDPNGVVTREQIASILYRYTQMIGVETYVDRSILQDFSDGGKVSSWAKDAMSWACNVGLISGKASGGKVLLDPKGNATRAEVASILMRYWYNVY